MNILQVEFVNGIVVGVLMTILVMVFGGWAYGEGKRDAKKEKDNG